MDKWQAVTADFFPPTIFLTKETFRNRALKQVSVSRTGEFRSSLGQSNTGKLQDSSTPLESFMRNVII